MTWALASGPAPFDAPLPANAVVAITFDTRTLTAYRATGQPIAAFDALRNTVAVAATSSPAAAVVGLDGPAQPVGDDSAAGQTSSWSGVQKTLVWGPSTPPVLGCATPGNAASVPPASPRFVPGDTVCYRLRIQFPTGMQLKNTKVADFLPPGSTYLAWAANAGNTVTTGAIDASMAPDTVSWNVGDLVGANRWTQLGQVFDVTLATRVPVDPNVNTNVDLVQNLLKVTSANTPGVTTSLRDMTNLTMAEPVLDLTKGVKAIGGVATLNGTRPDNGDGVPTGRADGGAVYAGTVVQYRIDVANTGPTDAGALGDATTVQIVDVLPGQTNCTDVALGTVPRTLTQRANDGDPFPAPTPARTGQPASTLTAATCTAGVIRMTVDRVPAGFSAEINYTLTVPTGTRQPVTGESLRNTAGVSSYRGARGDGPGTITYVPSSNADPAQSTPANAPAAHDQSIVTVPAPVFTKSATTGLTETGNDAATQATLGENVTYTVRFSIPAGVTARGPIRLNDPLPTGMEYVSGSASVRWGMNGTASPVAGCTNVNTCNLVTSSSSPGNPTFRFTTGTTVRLEVTSTTARYTNPAGASPANDDVFEIVFTARMKSGTTGSVKRNTATLTYVDVLGRTQTGTALVDTTVVAPSSPPRRRPRPRRTCAVATWSPTRSRSPTPVHRCTTSR